MEFALDIKGCRRFLADLLSDCQNSSFGLADGLLGSTDSNVSHTVVICSLVDVDLGACVVLDLVDACTASTEDTRNSTSRDGEFKNVIGFLFKLQSLEKFGFSTCHTLLATFDEDFVRLKWFASLVFAVFRRPPGECNLDPVFVLEANSIFATLANQGSMELGGDFEDFRCLVCLHCMSRTRWMWQTRRTNQSLHLSQDTLLGFLDVLLTSCDLSMASALPLNLCVLTDLDFGLLVNGLLLLRTVLLLLRNLVGKIHSDTKLVSQLLDTDSLRTNDSTDIFFVDIKFRRLKHYVQINNKANMEGLDSLT